MRRRNVHIFLLLVAITSYSAFLQAETNTTSLNLSLTHNAIKISDFGAVSMDDSSTGYKLYITTNISEYFSIEYGLQSLGEYTAEYDITVGTFQFLESHSIDFSKSLFAALRLTASLKDTLTDMEDRPDFLDSTYLYFKAGVTIWEAELNMDGFMYDAGTPYGPYGAHAKETGISTYYGFSIGYQASAHMVISIGWELHKNFGKGIELEYLDGSTDEYSGKDIKVIVIDVSYVF